MRACLRGLHRSLECTAGALRSQEGKFKAGRRIRCRHIVDQGVRISDRAWRHRVVINHYLNTRPPYAFDDFSEHRQDFLRVSGAGPDRTCLCVPTDGERETSLGSGDRPGRTLAARAHEDTQGDWILNFRKLVSFRPFTNFRRLSKVRNACGNEEASEELRCWISHGRLLIGAQQDESSNDGFHGNLRRPSFTLPRDNRDR